MEHEKRVMLDERECVSMEVAEHGVASPAADDADFIGVFPTKEKGHRATVAEGTSGDVFDVDSGVTGDEARGSAEEGGD